MAILHFVNSLSSDCDLEVGQSIQQVVTSLDLRMYCKPKKPLNFSDTYTWTFMQTAERG